MCRAWAHWSRIGALCDTVADTRHLARLKSFFLCFFTRFFWLTVGFRKIVQLGKLKKGKAAKLRCSSSMSTPIRPGTPSLSLNSAVRLQAYGPESTFGRDSGDAFGSDDYPAGRQQSLLQQQIAELKTAVDAGKGIIAKLQLDAKQQVRRVSTIAHPAVHRVHVPQRVFFIRVSIFGLCFFST
jgi:hypothetical protein